MSIWFKLGIATLVAGLVALFLAEMPDWFWHPLGTCHGSAIDIRDCKGYNSWSGSFSDIGEVTLIGGMLTIVLGFWHAHNCHVETCWRLSWHPDPEHNHPVCKVHHPHHSAGDNTTHTITAEGIRETQ